ncbi:MAG: SPW repeat protein [bacterium]|nr:SPW repeat protein [bacterium]
MRWYHWVVVGLAIWLLISPWLLGYSGLNLIVWNNLIVAILLIVFTFWNLSEAEKMKL